jgi:hypothetical protein
VELELIRQHDLRDHLVCRVVDELVSIVQKHTIEGLVMAAS